MLAVDMTSVKILGPTASVMCEFTNCCEAAKFLFRAGGGRIRAYCARHAEETAASIGIDLP
jgi:hypothetical protein